MCRLLANNRRANLNILLESAGPDSNSVISIWKLTRGIKTYHLFQSPVQDRGGLWLKTDDKKASAFAAHLSSTFMPFNLTDNTNREAIAHFLDTPTASTRSVRHTSPQEGMMQLKALQPKVTLGFDWIDNRTAKFLPRKEVLALLKIFYPMLGLGHFPRQWKRARIVMITKAGKSPTQLDSYHPISLPPTFSKVFERILLTAAGNRTHPTTPIQLQEV